MDFLRVWVSFDKFFFGEAQACRLFPTISHKKAWAAVPHLMGRDDKCRSGWNALNDFHSPASGSALDDD
jgi:hypothetical protein